MTSEESMLIDHSLIEASIEKHKKVAEEPQEFGIVIYTDGSGQLGRPNIGGYSFHGFVYTNTPSKQGVGVKGNTTTNHGYVINNILTHTNKTKNDIRDPSQPMAKCEHAIKLPIVYIDGHGSLLDATNNVAEAMGFLKAIEVIERISTQLPLSGIHFRVDSKYVISAVLGRFIYRENGYRKKDGNFLANKEMWIDIHDRLDAILEKVQCPWTIEWVEGHSDYYGNIQADKLAKMALVAGMNDYFFDDLSITPAATRWSNKDQEEPHYFLVDHKWYVAANKPLDHTSDGMSVIYTGTHTEDERVGQLESENIQSVSFIKNVPKIMHHVKDIVSELDQLETGMEVSGIYSGHLNHILNPAVGGTVLTANGKFARVNGWIKALTTFDNKELMTRLTGRLELDAINRFHDLAVLLENVRTGQLNDFTSVTDITDKVYAIEQGKKKETVKLILDNEPSLSVDVNVRTHDSNFMYNDVISKVTLTYGITTPRRRVFSGVKDNKPKVLVVTVFEPYVAYRYYTVIILENGECGIWTNVASNYRLL